jgi:hypothetical protein
MGYKTAPFGLLLSGPNGGVKTEAGCEWQVLCAQAGTNVSTLISGFCIQAYGVSEVYVIKS